MEGSTGEFITITITVCKLDLALSSQLSLCVPSCPDPSPRTKGPSCMDPLWRLQVTLPLRGCPRPGKSSGPG